MNAIEIKNLRKVYKSNIWGLNGLDLVIPTSQIFGILGPNGAGKSTMMNILAGLLKPTEGEFKMFGMKIRKGDYEYKRNVGFVLDQPHYISKLNIIDYLQFCGAMYQIPVVQCQNRIEELLIFLNLHEKKKSLIEKCSTGEKKKVSLASALIHHPDLLILDEPLEGIDPVSAKQIKDNLNFMASKGITVVLSSHNIEMVENLCDEIAIINKGKLLFQSKTADIRRKIKNELNQTPYKSLEEIFIDLVTDKHDKEKPISKLSWL